MHKSRAYHQKRASASATRRSSKRRALTAARQAHAKETPRNMRNRGNQPAPLGLFANALLKFDVNKFRGEKAA